MTIYTIIYIYTNIYNFMYIVNTLAVEYRSPKREREHHAKLDEPHEMYTINNKKRYTRASTVRIYRVMPICQRVHPIVQDVALIVEGT